MEELDLTLVNLANKKSQELNVQLSEQEIVMLRDSYYENSIQDKKNRKRKEIFGETYINKKKEIIENIIAYSLFILTWIAITSIPAATIYKTVETVATVSEYNDVLEEKMKEKLTDENINAYNQSHDNPILDGIEDYKNIKAKEKELKETGDYSLFGKNIADPDKEYKERYVEDIHFSNLREDAIDAVADEIVDEYKDYFVPLGGVKK